MKMPGIIHSIVYKGLRRWEVSPRLPNGMHHGRDALNELGLTLWGCSWELATRLVKGLEYINPGSTAASPSLLSQPSLSCTGHTMDVNDSSAEDWLDIAQTDMLHDSSNRSWADEPSQSTPRVEDPICLFGQFVSVTSSDSLKDKQRRTEFSAFLQNLCLKAPSLARYIVQEILNHLEDNSQPELQGSNGLKASTSTKKSSKPKKNSDHSYQPPKSSRTQQNALPGRVQRHPEAPTVRSSVNDKLVTPQSNHETVKITDSVVTHPLLSDCKEDIHQINTKEAPRDRVAAEGQSPAHHSNIASMASAALHQLKASHSSAKASEIRRQPVVTLDEPAKDAEDGTHPTSPRDAEQQDQSFVEIRGAVTDTHDPSPVLQDRVGLCQTTSQLLPATPVLQTGTAFQRPVSDEPNHQTTLCTTAKEGVTSRLMEDTPTTSPPGNPNTTFPGGMPSPPSSTQQQGSPCNTTVAQRVGLQSQARLAPSLEELPPLAEMVARAVHIIHEMSRRQEIPKEIHSRILSTLRSGLEGAVAPTAATRQSSLFLTSSSTAWSPSMWIRTLEAGHAHSKEVTILNIIEYMGASEWYDAELQQAKKAPPLTKRGIPRQRLATVILDKYLVECASAAEGLSEFASDDGTDHPLTQDSTGVQNRILDGRRKRLNNIFRRGRTLRNLVEKTHLGILFDPKIWNYAKASKGDVDKMAALFQADSQKMELLSILDKQVELLAKAGRPDLPRFLDSLESHSIIPSTEIVSLRAEYGPEIEPVAPDCVTKGIDSVVEQIGHALGKQSLDKDDFLIANGTEISNKMFDRLRSRDWLSSWDIAAALEMTDKPAFVRLGLSVQLHGVDADGDVTLISNPFRRWRTTIDNYRRKAKSDLEGSQLYICPLNINNNHFTLLEINEQTKMICHYNSTAAQGIVHRKTKSSLVRKAVEAEFKDLGFGYTEAPTPQQTDGWSCGLMVIRNAKRRMLGLEVGAWGDQVDPDRVIKEVLGDCLMFLEDKSLLSVPKKRRRVDDSSRTSNRLKRGE